MKYSIFSIIVISFGLLSFSPTENKIFTSNCNQTFRLMFFSQGSPTFWIGEDVGGECSYSQLIHIGIKDSSVSVSRSELKEFKKWENIPELKFLFSIYEEKTLALEDNIWVKNDLKIKPPVYDSLLSKEFTEHIRQGGSNAYSWFKVKGNDGIKLPEIEGIKTKLLFSYATGLYINYDISEVYYYPEKYILIFTHQPRKAVGLDTMHGFFIFKINRDT